MSSVFRLLRPWENRSQVSGKEVIFINPPPKNVRRVPRRKFTGNLPLLGDLNNDGKVGACDRSRLRHGASVALLKLVQNINYVDVITIEQFQQLALTMQDSCFEVREQFTTKLHKALDALKLPLDYLAFFALVAVDPSKERRVKAKQVHAFFFISNGFFRPRLKCCLAKFKIPLNLPYPT